jgi:TolA-binding protein
MGKEKFNIFRKSKGFIISRFNNRTNKLPNIIVSALAAILILCALSLVMATSLFSQEVDPFYLKLLAQGEKSLLAKNYREAIKELEIAAFGLHKEEKLKAKALVYMSMSYYYLKDMENCEKYMRQAFDMVGREGIADLEKEIDESLRNDFLKLLVHFKLTSGALKEGPLGRQEKTEKEEPKAKESAHKTEVPVKKETPRTQATKPRPRAVQDPVKALEESIKDSPRNVGPYYELYELLIKNNDAKAAKKTLENLVRYNPYEINGLFLLGKINFSTRKYKDAEKNFEKIVTLSRRIEVEENVLDETRAYLILSSYLRGDRKKAQELVSEFMSALSPRKISTLGLDIREKERLERIIKAYQAQFEVERKKQRIKSLETAIERQPRNAELYHELYSLYKEEKNVSAARDLLQKWVRNKPHDVRGRFLLGKDEFGQNHFLDAQSHFNRILAANEKSDVNRELILKSMIYAAICFHRLHKREDAKKFIRYLNDSASAAEIQRMVEEEGLDDEWQRIKEYY